MKSIDDSILVIDSGLGGLSVLKEIRKALPNENIIYFGDSKNAPYGEKEVEELYSIVTNNIDHLISLNKIKALVLACNTMSVNLFDRLVSRYSDLIIVPTRPNIYEPIQNSDKGTILVLSTPLTSKSKWMEEEIKKYSNRKIVSLGMPGLIDFVENFDFNYEKLEKYFINKISDDVLEDVVCVSLACTHYPFLKKYINEFLLNRGHKVVFYDGSSITTNSLKDELNRCNLLNNNIGIGDLIILNSLNNDEMIEKSFKLLEI